MRAGRKRALIQSGFELECLHRYLRAREVAIEVKIRYLKMSEIER